MEAHVGVAIQNCWLKLSSKELQRNIMWRLYLCAIYEKMKHADMLVIASPVYFYGISAQLKAVIDRFHNPIRDSFHIKKMALLLVGAATLPELFDAILTEYNLCLKFFNIEDAGKVLVRGVKDKGDIKTTDALNEAYMLGLSITPSANTRVL